MNDPIANGQLELACRLGSVDDIPEAIEEGAHVDCNGYSPMFIAIQNGDRAVIAALVEHGADTAVFEVDPEKGDPVDQLMAMAPDTGGGESEGEGMVELDAKMIRAFQRMITNKGIAEPMHKGRGGEYAAFADGLRSIAAEECHAVVREFLELAEAAVAEVEDEERDASLLAHLKDEAQQETLTALTERYHQAAEEEEPGELLKVYLKERKEVS